MRKKLETGAGARSVGSGMGSAGEVIRDPGWTCVEYVRTGRSERDIVMKVIFNTIREGRVEDRHG